MLILVSSSVSEIHRVKLQIVGLEVCPYQQPTNRLGTFALMPRGWISRLKQIPRPCHLNMTYLYSRRWYSQKKYFPNGSIFFRIYKLVNTGFFGKKYKGIKMPRGWISRFKKAHNLEICTRPTCRSRRWYSHKKYFPIGSIFFRIYKLVNTGVFLEKI